MHFMNEPDIDHAAFQYANHPILGKATKLLKAFKDKVNANSDGWPYWSAPVKAADKLMTLVENPAEATEAAYKKALTPIKSFCTKRDWAFPGTPEKAAPLFTEPRLPPDAKPTDMRLTWNPIAQRLLLGRRIAQVRYMTKDEVMQARWPGAAIVLILDNGTKVTVSQDDEGNGPGALFVDLADGDSETLPVL